MTAVPLVCHISKPASVNAGECHKFCMQAANKPDDEDAVPALQPKPQTQSKCAA